MKLPTLNFSKARIDALPIPPTGRRVEYQDERTPGLALRVFSTGAKTFLVRRVVAGKQERIKLGRYPDITIDQARRMAAKTTGAIADGRNPNADKRALSSEITLGELFNRYLEEHAKARKKSWRKDGAQFRLYLAPWRNRKLSTISASDVCALHSRLGTNNGRYAANRLLALISALFNRAIDLGWKGDNPASRVARFRERSRDRFLDADELVRFFQALAEEPNDVIRDFLLLALLTGARRSNVLEMRWEQVNLEKAIWRIPDTKSGDSHTVPLVPEALEILKQRKAHAETREDCRAEEKPWVLPGRGEAGHLVEPAKAWRRICERAGLKDVRIHDLRRTLGSWQAASGASLPVIGKTLAHKNVSTTAIYARLNLDPVRESMTVATRAMMKAGLRKRDSDGADANADESEV